MSQPNGPGIVKDARTPAITTPATVAESEARSEGIMRAGFAADQRPPRPMNFGLPYRGHRRPLLGSHVRGRRPSVTSPHGARRRARCLLESLATKPAVGPLGRTLGAPWSRVQGAPSLPRCRARRRALRDARLVGERSHSLRRSARPPWLRCWEFGAVERNARSAECHPRVRARPDPCGVASGGSSPLLYRQGR